MSGERKARLDRGDALARGTYRELFRDPVFAAPPLIDSEDRPIGEAGMPKEDRVGVELKVRRCPWPGSRQGKWMNVTALRQVSHHWPAVLDDLVHLRERYLASRQRDASEGLDLFHLWELAKIATSLPVYCIQRADQPLRQGEIPARTAALYKVAQGLHMTAEDMMAHGYELDTPIDSPGFEEFTERWGVFIAAGYRACSGSPKMIREFVDTALYGGAPPDVANVAWLEALTGGLDEPIEYGTAVCRQRFAWMAAVAEHRLLLEAMAAVLEQSADEGGEPEALTARIRGQLQLVLQAGLFKKATSSQVERMFAHLSDELGVTARAPLDHEAPARGLLPVAATARLSHLPGETGSGLTSFCAVVGRHVSNGLLWARFLQAVWTIEDRWRACCEPLQRDIDRLLGREPISISRREFSSIFARVTMAARELESHLGLACEPAAQGFHVDIDGHRFSLPRLDSTGAQR